MDNAVIAHSYQKHLLILCPTKMSRPQLTLKLKILGIIFRVKLITAKSMTDVLTRSRVELKCIRVLSWH